MQVHLESKAMHVFWFRDDERARLVSECSGNFIVADGQF